MNTKKIISIFASLLYFFGLSSHVTATEIQPSDINPNILISGEYHPADAMAAKEVHEETIYSTPHPYGGSNGIYGMDLFNDNGAAGADLYSQTVAIRFQPENDYQLKSIGLWLMNNSNAEHGEVKISLHKNDTSVDPEGLPGEVIDTWKIKAITAGGWTPRFDKVEIEKGPKLKEHQFYWIVAQSPEKSHDNPIWNIAHDGSAYVAIKHNEEWFPGGWVAAVSIDIQGVRL